MAKLNYQYDDPDTSGSAGTSRGRFILLFLLISVAIAGGVYYFWPQSEAPKPPVKPETTTAKGAAPETPATPGSSAVSPGETRPAVTPAPGGSAPETPAATATAPIPADPVPPPPYTKGVETPAERGAADAPVVPDAPEPAPAALLALDKARGLLRDVKAAAAAKCAQEALAGAVENSKFYREAWQVLSDARTALVYSGAPGEGNLQHTIRAKDTVGTLARRYKTTGELLSRVNGIVKGRIFVGRTLCVTPGDWKIRVEKRARLLKLYRITADGKATLFLVREVGVGRFGKTPTAEFAISQRVRHPDWYLSDGRIIKYNDPENQLGDYFLKLAPVNTPGRPLLGYGIHGSRDENTVGRSLSNGCIRMRNAEVEALYYLVPSGCRVEIVE